MALGKVAGVSAAKLERLLNLTALLLDTERPISAETIQAQLEAYPRDLASFRRAFERDKDELRSMGIPLRVEKIPGTMPAADGYRIPRDEYALRDPGLEPEELAALHLAASAVQVEGLPAREGLLKLGGLTANPSVGDLGVRVAPLPADENLARLFAAVSERRPVRLTYHDEERTIDPYRLEFQRGRWYLTGYDHLRDEERNYRLDRIDGAVVATDLPSFDLPTTNVPGRARGAWELGGDEPTLAVLRVDGPQSRWVVHHVGPDRARSVAVDDAGGGSVVIELPVTNHAALRSFVLSFLEHAELLEPEELRRDLVEWLEQVP
ncbi:MAG: helix-turn-helix transcriptional regulator [Microthrixaceae bacterium]